MRGPRWPGEKGARAFTAAAPPLPRGRITRPPPVVLIAIIGYVSAISLGLCALTVAYALIELLRGETSALSTLAAFIVLGAAFWWVNGRLIAWWVRRQVPDAEPISR